MGMESSAEIDEERNQNGNATETFSTSEKSLNGRNEAEFTPEPEEVKKNKKYTRIQWFTLITLTLANFCSGTCISLQAPFFPSEAEKKGATATQYGFIFGIFQLALFVTSIVLGKIVRYIPPKFLLNSGLLTVGVTCILFGTLDLVFDSTSFVALALIIRLFEGIGSASLKMSCHIITASIFQESVGTAYGILETFYAISYFTGPSLGGALYDLGGYGLPFWTMGTITVVDAVAIFFFLPNGERPEISDKGSMLKLWLHPGTMLCSLSIFTSYIYIGFNQTTLEPHLRRFALSGFLLGMMFTIAGTLYAISTPLWGWLCDKKSYTSLLNLLGCIGMVFSVLLIGPAPFFNTEPRIWLIIVALILMGLALGAKLISAFTGALEDTMNRGLPQNVSTYGVVSSMKTTSQSLGAFVGSSVGGYFLHHMGYRKASMTLLILENVLIISLIISICSKGSRIRKAELIHTTEKVSASEKYIPKDEEFGKNNMKATSTQRRTLYYR